jgi:hypothetical protein
MMSNSCLVLAELVMIGRCAARVPAPVIHGKMLFVQV